jgi:hypothetical protein
MSHSAAAAPATVVRVLRGADFINPNTRAEEAPVLNEGEQVHAEDLLAAATSRTASVKLPSTILHWRQALSAAATSLAKSAAAAAGQQAPQGASSTIASSLPRTADKYTSAIPATIKVVEFKPPETIAFRGLHKTDGQLQFQWRDLDAAVGGVHQPKVVASATAVVGGASGSTNAATTKTKKMWLPHELSEADRAALDHLMLKWKESRTGASTAGKATATAAPVDDERALGVRIRQREEESKTQGAESSSAGADAGGGDFDLEEILRRANDALLRG